MAVTQYIGARYVPKFNDQMEWNSTNTYEPLTVVLHEGNSYTSKQDVPAGIDIANTDYWAETGNYNAQVEAYRQQVLNLQQNVSANTTSNTNQDAQLAGTTDSGLKQLISANTTSISANTTSNTNQDAQLAGTTDSGLKSLISANTTSNTNQDAQLAGTTDSGLKQRITAETTRATAAEQANADTITAETTRATAAENANADAIQNLAFTNPLYGVCRAGLDNNTWKYVATYDLSSIGTMGNLPSRGTSNDYSDSSNLFEHNGILYYPQQDHRDIYATIDGETWESGYGLNYPSPLGTNYFQWAPMLFEDKDNNIKLCLTRQYNSESITNPISNTSNFRLDVFDCSINSDGKINISSNYITVLSSGSHIDGYITYTNTYGYIMVCKNEQTCQIECYTGNELTNMTLQGTLPYVGCEAPKFYIQDNDISLITQAYSLHTGNPQNLGSYVGNFYLTTRISFNPFSYDGISLISCPSNYRHISFIMNSKILSKYARKHGILPYNSGSENKIFHTNIDDNDIYPAALPMKIAFHVEGGNRTVTIHNSTLGLGLNSSSINYIIGFTNNEPTITTEDKKYTRVLKDGDVVPLYINKDGTLLFT